MSERVRDGFVEILPAHWVRIGAIDHIEEVTEARDPYHYGLGYRAIVFTPGTTGTGGGGRYTDMTVELLRNIVASHFERLAACNP